MTLKYTSTSLVNAYYQQITDAFERLGKPIDQSDAEKLSCFLLKTMGSESRDYHRPEHPLDVSKRLLPIGQLAALFHDIVYVQVDPTWGKSVSDILYPFIPTNTFSVNVKGALNHVIDPWQKIVVSIFGFDNETDLIPMKGANEFLSALVFCQCMRPYLNPEELLRGISCIEATIPFRKVDGEGNSPADRLKARIKKVMQSPEGRYFSGQIDVELIISECRSLIENDLASFGSESPSDFISNSWNVMIENNPPLRNTFFYISDYRRAIFGTLGFYMSLDPINLYWTNNKNNDKHHEQLINRTKSNLDFAASYMKCIATAVCLSEAIAMKTGGDAPFELFFGPRKKSRTHDPVIIDNLVKLPENINTGETLSTEDLEIYNILRNGRELRSRFDHKTSALSAFIFYNTAKQIRDELFKVSQLFTLGKITADELIAEVPISIVSETISFFEKTALSRSKLLADLRLKQTENRLKIAS